MSNIQMTVDYCIDTYRKAFTNKYGEERATNLNFIKIGSDLIQVEVEGIIADPVNKNELLAFAEALEPTEKY